MSIFGANVIIPIERECRQSIRRAGNGGEERRSPAQEEEPARAPQPQWLASCTASATLHSSESSEVQ